MNSKKERLGLMDSYNDALLIREILKEVGYKGELVDMDLSAQEQRKFPTSFEGLEYEQEYDTLVVKKESLGPEHEHDYNVNILPCIAIILSFKFEPATKKDPENVQRVLNKTKVKEMRDRLINPKGHMHNTGTFVGILENNEKSSYKYNSAGKFVINYRHVLFSLIKSANSFIDQGQSTTNIDRQQKTKDILNKSREDESYCADSFHRCIAALLAEKGDRPFVSVILSNVPKIVAYEVFNDANEKQTKPNVEQVDNAKENSGKFTQDEQLSRDISRTLNDDNTSPLFNRVNFVTESDPSTIIRQSKLRSLMEKNMLKLLHKELHLNQKGCAAIIKSYFLAFRNFYSDKIWDDRKDYLLTKAIGFDIQTRLFDSFFKRTSNKEEMVTTNNHQSFLNKFNYVLKESGGQFIQIQIENTSKTLDFRSGTKNFGSYSSGAGIKALEDSIKEVITTKIIDYHNKEERKNG